MREVETDKIMEGQAGIQKGIGQAKIRRGRDHSKMEKGRGQGRI